MPKVTSVASQVVPLNTNLSTSLELLFLGMWSGLNPKPFYNVYITTHAHTLKHSHTLTHTYSSSYQTHLHGEGMSIKTLSTEMSLFASKDRRFMM